VSNQSTTPALHSHFQLRLAVGGKTPEPVHLLMRTRKNCLLVETDVVTGNSAAVKSIFCAYSGAYQARAHQKCRDRQQSASFKARPLPECRSSSHAFTLDQSHAAQDWFGLKRG